jgi:prepilin-type processing-associated H-X9-DG protein
LAPGEFTPPAATASGFGLGAARVRSSNNLKMLGLAMHEYHNQYNKLPRPAIYSPQGKPLLSWRVAILPFLEREALYMQFHLDEPWDSEHNLELLKVMPKEYAPVVGADSAPPYATYYQVFTSDWVRAQATPGWAMFNSQPQPDGLALTMAMVSAADGTANTLMIAEAWHPVPWTRPDDLPYAPDQPLPKLGGLFPNGFNAAFADGSVRFINRDTDEAVLRALITWNGGEQIDRTKWP